MPDSQRSLEAAQSKHSATWLYIVALAAALHFSIDYLTLTIPMIPFGPYIQGQTQAPFRYRILVAWLYHGFAALVSGHHFPHLFLQLNPPFDSRQDWFLVLLSTASLLLAVLATDRGIRTATGSTRYRWLSLLVLPMAYFNYILPPHRGLFYPYDLPALAFFSVLTWLALKGNYLWFAVVFIPAEINRETVIYALALFFLLHFGRQPLKRLLPYCAALGLAFVGIKYALYVELHQSCMGCEALSQNQLHYNLRQLANPIFWIAAPSVFAYAWLALVPLWRYIQPRLRMSFLALLVLWALPMLFIGILRELRIFAELSTLLTVLVADGLAHYSTRKAGAPGSRIGNPPAIAPTL